MKAAVPVKSYIVRIYRRARKNPRLLVGVVEEVGRHGRKAFTTFDELWEILNRARAGGGPVKRISAGPGLPGGPAP